MNCIIIYFYEHKCTMSRVMPLVRPYYSSNLFLPSLDSTYLQLQSDFILSTIFFFFFLSSTHVSSFKREIFHWTNCISQFLIHRIYHTNFVPRLTRKITLYSSVLKLPRMKVDTFPHRKIVSSLFLNTELTLNDEYFLFNSSERRKYTKQFFINFLSLLN